MTPISGLKVDLLRLVRSVLTEEDIVDAGPLARTIHMDLHLHDFAFSSIL